MTPDNLEQFCDLLLHKRLNESQNAMEMIIKGVSDMIPYHLLHIFTWKEMERLVCGSTEVDIKLLERYVTCMSLL